MGQKNIGGHSEYWSIGNPGLGLESNAWVQYMGQQYLSRCEYHRKTPPCAPLTMNSEKVGKYNENDLPAYTPMPW